MAPVPQHVHEIIRRIEQRLATFYDLSLPFEAGSFILPIVPTPLDNQPGGRLLVMNEDGLFLGVELNEAAADGVRDISPGNEMSLRQLAALSVVIEEISHFHLVVQRASAGLETSKLELEWQGEVDKLVVLAALSTGGNLGKTLHRLHDILSGSFRVRSDLPAEDAARYEEATRYFECLWFRNLKPAITSTAAANTSPLEHPAVRQYLRRLYRKSWQQKVESLAA